MEHVPYKGSSPMHSDLLGGTLQFAVDTLTQNVPYMKDNKLVGIAVTSRKRTTLSPNVPTVGEAGFPKLLAENFLGVSAPAGVPREVIDKVHKAVAEVVARHPVTKVVCVERPGEDPRGLRSAARLRAPGGIHRHSR